MNEILPLAAIKERIVGIYHKCAPMDQGSDLEPLDSLAFMEFIIGLEQEFGISIHAEDVTEEAFSTADNIAVYIKTRLESSSNGSQ